MFGASSESGCVAGISFAAAYSSSKSDKSLGLLGSSSGASRIAYHTSSLRRVFLDACVLPYNVTIPFQNLNKNYKASSPERLEVPTVPNPCSKTGACPGRAGAASAEGASITRHMVKLIIQHHVVEL